MSKHFTSIAAAVAIAASSIMSTGVALADGMTQYVPLFVYRTGPYASSGSLWFAGERDYFTYINEVEGGVNGVKFAIEEFETEYNPDRAVEAYERSKGGKDGSPTAFIMTHSTPATYALMDRAREDKIPLFDPAGGPSESKNGLVFPYVFPLLLTFYGQGSVAVNFIAEEFGGFENLKGKKIVTVYHDSGYGRASQPVMTKLAEKYGFIDVQIPVAHPGSEQTAIWRQVRAEKPDYVVLRTWGVMTPVGIKTAKRFGIDTTRMLGDVWAGSRADMIPAGDAAIGYNAIAPYPGGSDFDVHAKLKEHVIDKGLSNLENSDADFGAVFYNVGVVNAALAVEGMRIAMEKFGNRPLTGEEMLWGLENMTIDAARLEELGMTGLLQELKVTPQDHEGGGAARVQEWTGNGWNLVSDWIAVDDSVVDPLIEAKAAEYAAEQGITPRVVD
ncbi:amino acid/amide ABC transporter substrate-binding protein (HAAT family) [Rhodovulum imhoffii]|uniref:Amino acid/amide ABC transporter substrate-binding protein (HAAT family) n=1 Tax=Rhodovulum imhoffii TaxID=365340 RepID=A0A2T5BNS2_9RHOB|nr:ABC transporter substrate-binding protein [Rhodovulum imhoffii]MBK5933611.1 ABC transporter permease [Rhodovulum imhoffii]PTN00611.1 amino acid/amide ABC transporter substrate-binding protein (HAAT family) [Rhodovulum imhoffii]